jgi:hypothetical protein
MSTPSENTNVPENPIFEPFPEPQTMPSGWDLSGLTPNSEPAPVTPADNSADTSTP